MKKKYDPNRPLVLKDLEEFSVQIITAITEVLKGYATKEDFVKLEGKVDKLDQKVDHVSFKVSDVRRRVIDLETDRIGRQEFTELKRTVQTAK